MGIPVERDDEVVSATRFARDGANSVPEQVLVVTKHGEVFSLVWRSSGIQGWECKRVDVKNV